MLERTNRAPNTALTERLLIARYFPYIHAACFYNFQESTTTMCYHLYFIALFLEARSDNKLILHFLHIESDRSSPNLQLLMTKQGNKKICKFFPPRLLNPALFLTLDASARGKSINMSATSAFAAVKECYKLIEPYNMSHPSTKADPCIYSKPVSSPPDF